MGRREVGRKGRKQTEQEQNEQRQEKEKKKTKNEKWMAAGNKTLQPKKKTNKNGGLWNRKNNNQSVYQVTIHCTNQPASHPAIESK